MKILLQNIGEFDKLLEKRGEAPVLSSFIYN